VEYKDKFTISINDAAEISGISKSTLYKKSALGELPVLKIGSRVLIKKTDFEEWIDSHSRKDYISMTDKPEERFCNCAFKNFR